MDMHDFMPHGHCYLWKTDILLMHVISDAVITLSYYAIPLVLVYISSKTKGKLPFNRLFLLFAIFILACGTTHLLEIVNVWQSRYYLSGIIKIITAIASVLTAASLIPYVPKLIYFLNNIDESKLVKDNKKL